MAEKSVRLSRSDDALSLYIVLGIFLLLAIRNPALNRGLIAFTGWSSLAHAAVMAVQSAQLGTKRTALPPLGVIGLICVVLIRVTPAKKSGELPDRRLSSSQGL